MKKTGWIYYMIPILGIVFCFLYLNRAVIDVAYTDYIRLINSYLPDVWNPKKFFVADILTRIPLNYLERIVNVTFFGYNTVVEMVLGVLGLGASAFVLAGYCKKHQIGFGWYLSLMWMLFSLNKWEMLTNGTGWVHFTAFACFYYHYIVVDRVYRQEAKRYDKVRMCVLPFLITLGVAGPYCAIYSATLLLAYIWMIGYRSIRAKSILKVKSQIKECFGYILCTLIPLFLYIWSNSCTVEEHAGAVDAELIPTLLEKPLFFIQFIFHSLASTVLGDECIRQVLSADWQIVLLGVFVFLCYLFALYLNWKYKIYERSLLPLMLLVAGGMNHILIMLSRWIFLKLDYGMSSRYALQFQVGIFGIFLSFAFAFYSSRSYRRKKKDKKKLENKTKNKIEKKTEHKTKNKTIERRKKKSQKQSSNRWVNGLTWVCIGLTLVFLAGTSYTSYKEWEKAPYRKENLIQKREAALHYEELTDKELEDIFQYRKGPDQIRNALRILKENNWNVFRGQEE